MTLAGKRAEIAAALAGVPGVHAYPYRPPAPTEGDAWPLFGPLDRDAGDAFVATWRVRVLMPQDEVAATDWLDAHWPALFEAVQRVGFVVRATPVMNPAAGVDQFAFEITFRAEE